MKNYQDKELDQIFMANALHLAQKGSGYVSPNPLVGCVVVKNGTIIGRGFHKYFGGPHAEVYALRQAGKNAKGATLYVNLEPCNHFGKTPPCTDLIIKKGIKRVVIGMKDPNPLVSGKGIAQLRKSKIKVDVGILQSECKKLNEIFTKFITTHKPFVALKIAQTINGKLSLESKRLKWITNDLSRNLVHKFRSIYDAVLVGAGTVNQDNPKLTVRHMHGRNPIRIIIDGPLSVNIRSKIFSQKGKTILLVSKKIVKKKKNKLIYLQNKGVNVIELPSDKKYYIKINKILKVMAEKGITSILVEGGAEIFREFIKTKLVDKVYIFIAPLVTSNGDVSLTEWTKDQFFLRLQNVEVRNIKDDIFIEAYNNKK